jgi:YD repeat-containing protein
MSNDNAGEPSNAQDGEAESFPVSPEPALAGPAAPCPDCRGSGRVVLLVSSQPCALCGGSGRLEPAGGTTPGPAAPRGRPDAAAPRTLGRTIEESDGEVVRTYAYDAYGRLASVTHTRRPCGEIAVWRYDRPVAGPENAKHPGGGEPAASEPGLPALCAECSGTGYVTFPGGSRRCSRCRAR